MQEASGLSSTEDIAEIEHSDSEETSISAFRRIRFDTGLQALGIEELVKLIELKRDHIPYSDVQVQKLLQQLKSGQEELYELAEAERRQCIDEYVQNFKITGSRASALERAKNVRRRRSRITLAEAERRQRMDGYPQTFEIGRMNAVGPFTLDHPIVSQILPFI